MPAFLMLVGFNLFNKCQFFSWVPCRGVLDLHRISVAAITFYKYPSVSKRDRGTSLFRWLLQGKTKAPGTAPHLSSACGAALPPRKSGKEEGTSLKVEAVHPLTNGYRDGSPRTARYSFSSPYGNEQGK
ncbi:hypothetical protein SUGI_0916270 [Cryptomeria japonica]|nr:hypothetical protein SUGI_0916270 [Cryptomeria japonica]